MRLVGYIRVSSQDQVEAFSLPAQRRALTAFCEAKGHELVGILADEGKSAASDTIAKRPGFQMAVDMVKRREADAILVHKPDRAARNLRVMLNILHDLGGGILAVEGDFDYASPEGRFRAHVLGAVAQLYSDNLSREVKKGKSERRRQGLWNARLPFGLRKQPGDDQARLAPIRDDVPVLCTVADRREWSRWDALVYMFERNAGGASLPTILAEMHDIGFRLGLGTVWELLNNRFFLGEVPVSDRGPGKRWDWMPGAHRPFIDPDLFERAARARQINKSGGANIRRGARVYALTGLGRCAGCGDRLHCRTDKTGKPVVFCHTRHKLHTCAQPRTVMQTLEQQCLSILERVAPPDEVIDWIVEELRETTRDTRRERIALQNRLKRLRNLYQWGDMPDSEYRTNKAEIELQLNRLEPVETDGRMIERLRGFLKDLPSGYQRATPEERNAILREVLSEVEVDRGTVTRFGLTPPYDAIVAPWVADAIGSSGRARRRR